MALPGAAAVVVALGLLGAVLGVAMAVVLWRIGPGRPLHRWLSAVLVLEGAAQLVALVHLAEGRAWQEAVVRGHQTAAFALPVAYLGFLSHLDTPLVRWLRLRAVRGALVAATAVLLVAVWTRPAAFVEWRDAPVPDLYFGAWAEPAYAAVGFVSLFGLVAAVSALRRAPKGGAERRQARAFAIAFGARDVLFAIPLVVPILAGDPSLLGGYRSLGALGFVPFFATPLFVLLMAWGILRNRLLDLDVKVRRTVHAGTTAAVFLAAFFVVSESAALFFQASVGPYLGILAAGCLVLALAPIQRMAERVAQAAVPDARRVDDLGPAERRDLYREQVQIAWEDGSLSVKERRVLEVARQRLGIPEAEAAGIEREALARLR